MNPPFNELLESIIGNKPTPLKEIVDRKLSEKHMLIKELGPLLKIKDSQVKRILAGESGTRPAGIRTLQEFLEFSPDVWAFFWNQDKNRARTFTDFDELRKKHVQSYKKTIIEPQKPSASSTSKFTNTLTPTKIVVALIVACAALYAISGFKLKEDPPITTNSQGPCLVELRETTPPTFNCDGIGAFTVTGSTLKKWNTKTSLVYVPHSWNVIARYETWGGQNYSVLQKDKSGFVKLHPGFNHLDSDTYDVFDNASLDGSARRSAQKELNDRMQYLIVSKATTDEAVKVWEHDEKSDPNNIQIALD